MNLFYFDAMFILILSVQTFVVYLDNHINLNIFYKKITSKNIATAYTQRSKYLYITRSIFFITPPLLGVGLTRFTQNEFVFCFISAVCITFVLSFIQFWIFIRNNLFFNFLKDNFFLLFKKISFYIGIFAFSIYLLSPFILNFIAFIFSDSALWIVQLNPVVSSIATTYIVFCLDPKISKAVDKSSNLNLVFFESILVRILGRFLILLISLLIFLKI